MYTPLNVLRWLAVLPAFIISAVMVRWLFDHAFAVIFREVSHALAQSNGFAEHFFLGPLYVFFLSIGTATIPMVFSCIVAPSNRPTVRIVLAVLFGCYLLAVLANVVISDRVQYEMDVWIRHALVFVGSSLGIASTFKMKMSGVNVSVYSMLRIEETR
jgi:hypothetical protein